ncbi:MAG: hypothetical protein M1835_006461 [Candelina submexicana]|nr:MAG: hypothetical protein M1835_006461 [Candelina submexicana]
MVSVASLLNPAPSDSSNQYSAFPGPHQSNYSTDSHGRVTKKQKMSKDAAVFTKGKIRGENRFPPFEITDEELLEHHRRFQIFPTKDIGVYPRHIPYNSDKKSFLEKTGRESFEVFQYTFRLPGEEKEYSVMWDYNIGLVRITPFFKCRNYSKTTPAKMLNANPGLRDICHSITGGALAAQGYWMPYACALAIAATFCHSIRHALTPLFGPSFPALCIPPDSPQFGRMVIDRSIVESCTEEAHRFKLMEMENERYDSIKTSECSNAEERGGGGRGRAAWSRSTRFLRPKTQLKPADIESGYGTDTDQERRGEGKFEDDLSTPEASTTPQWTCANTTTTTPFSSPSSLFSPSERNDSAQKKTVYDEPKTWLSSVPRSSKRSWEEYSSSPPPPSSPSPPDEQQAEKSATPDRDLEDRIQNLDDDDDDESSSDDGDLFRMGLTREARAAYLLMQLHTADKNLSRRNQNQNQNQNQAGHGNERLRRRRRRRRASN